MCWEWVPEAQECADVEVGLALGDLVGWCLTVAVAFAHLHELFDCREAFHLALEEEDVLLRDTSVLSCLDRYIHGARARG